MTKEGDIIEGDIVIDDFLTERGRKITLILDKKNKINFYSYDLNQYGFRDNTIKILRDFYPFYNEDKYFRVKEATVLIRGRLTAYYVDDELKRFSNRPQPIIGSIPEDKKYTYMPYTLLILEDENGKIGGIRKDNYRGDLLLFFRDCPECHKRIRSKKFKYRHIDDLIKEYNNYEFDLK